MHFYLENNDKYRLGRIQCKEYSLKTPTCFLYTKLGKFKIAIFIQISSNLLLLKTVCLVNFL